MKIGILLTTSPEHQNGHTVCALSDVFLAGGHQVSLFLMDDGIFHISKHHKLGMAESLEDLLSKDIKISICSQSAEKRGVSEAEGIKGIEWASQRELARIVAISDRFLNFGD